MIVRLVRRLLRRKITPCYKTLYTGGAPGPREASDVRVNDDDGPYVDVDETDWSVSPCHRQFAQTAF